jgi:hypothetical protein
MNTELFSVTWLRYQLLILHGTGEMNEQIQDICEMIVADENQSTPRKIWPTNPTKAGLEEKPNYWTN